MKRRSLLNIRVISPEIAYMGKYRLRRKRRVKEMGFQLLISKREVETDTGEFKIGEGVT